MPNTSTPSSFGVLLLALGGPHSLEDVEPYLGRLLSDPHLLQLPFRRWVGPCLAQWIARRRAPQSRQRYAAIGGASPILKETAKQAQALARRLSLPVAFALHASSPGVSEALAELAKNGVRRLVVIPLFPHYSRTTSLMVVDSFRQMGGNRVESKVIWEHHLHPGFIEAMAAQIYESLKSSAGGPQTHLLFTAHSLPVAYTQKGDPYISQIQASMAAIARRLGITSPYSLAFQSRFGPLRWHGPSLDEALPSLRRARVRRLIICPLSFVAENLETLYDLDIVFKGQCQAAGIETVRIPALGHSHDYIRTLADLAKAALKEWSHADC